MGISIVIGVLGVFFTIYFFALFDASVESPGGRVSNIGLMQRQQMGLILGIAMSLGGFGTAVFASTRVPARKVRSGDSQQGPAAEFKCKVCLVFHGSRPDVFSHAKYAHRLRGTAIDEAIEAPAAPLGSYRCKACGEFSEHQAVVQAHVQDAHGIEPAHISEQIEKVGDSPRPAIA